MEKDIEMHDVNGSGIGEVVPGEFTPFVWEIWSVGEFYPYDEKTFIPRLKVGDEVWIKSDSAGYSHVALYIGNSEIIHVAEVKKTSLFPGKTLVRQDLLSDVVTDRDVVGHRPTDVTDGERQLIVERASKDVGNLWPYVLTTENCEHQVKYWITGDKDYKGITSTQIKDYYTVAGIFAIVGLAVGGCIFGSLLDNALTITFSALGTSLGFAVLGVATKYILTAFEHRTSCY